MQITTIETLEQTPIGTTLYLINPFGNTDQTQVSLEEFTVYSVTDVDNIGKKMTGRKVFKAFGIDYTTHNFLGDMLGRCKYVFTTIVEAEKKLEEVHNGLHKDVVLDHHEDCREMQRWFDFDLV